MQLSYLRRFLLSTVCLALTYGFLHTTLLASHRVLAAASHNPNWQVMSSPDPGSTNNTLNGVAALSANDIWAVGSYQNNSPTFTFTTHWDGSTWQVIPSPNPGIGANELTAVSAVSTNDVWAVGDYGGGLNTLIEHWDGSSWQVVPGPISTGYLSAITATSSTNVWAVGRDDNFHTLIEHWDGTKWSVITSPSPGNESNFLFGVTAVSSTDAWVVGREINDYQAYTLTEHWNGTQWDLVASQQPGGDPQLNGITALPSGKVWAVGRSTLSGSDNRTFVEGWDGTAWTSMPSLSEKRSTSFLISAVALSINSLWTVGQVKSIPGHPHPVKSLIEHWDGAKWSIISSPELGISVALTGIVSVPGTSQLLMVGTYQSNSSVSQTVIEIYQ